ncbi:MAG TPA: PSD1 and planctomycete cytochrome C domain-containing protein [Pirellulaceae bacterium]|jgi:hypothetical protein|nr:PSD1 and planctomycete cytochrome C domain-containing protein [Pirellulaceae bacterium]
MVSRIRSVILLVSFALAGSLDATARADDDAAFFESKIRPLLVRRCYECHSSESKELGGKLRLDHRRGILDGGESGPAIVAGDSEGSLLVQALRYDGVKMPPDAPLPEGEIANVVHWIKSGAFDPRTDTPPPVGSQNDAQPLWSLQPIVDVPSPEVKDPAWPADPIDRFVLARLEAAELKPAADADARTLIRRLYDDLVGLPPSFDEVERFAAEFPRDETALARLVDPLLASPRFGERWGRRWLDVARYGESNGNDGLGRNPTFPHAWRYRDYIIDAVARDVPYDRFVTEQIAGDLLPFETPEERDRQIVATGFLAVGSKPAKAMNDEFDMDVVADQIDVVSRGILGISVACARCHDHKFDPVPTRDYYALAGIFASTETLWGLSGHEGLSAPSTDLHVLTTAPKVPPPAGFVETAILLESNTGLPKTIPPPNWEPGTPLAMGLRDRASPADCKLCIDGMSTKPGGAVPRGFLSAPRLPKSESFSVPGNQSGRLQLARWMTSEDHPLTARVAANRVWMHLFGEGIVRTPDDFGVYGDSPSHPELLDHLATRLMREGWSIKRLVRTIVLSRTYRLSGEADPRLLEADAENRLFGRRTLRRLDAESLRDAMLAVSGCLDLRADGGSVIRHRDILVNLAEDLHQTTDRRSVYLCYLRSSPPPELAAFDLPSFVTTTSRRDVSTIPGQALYLLNNPFVQKQASRMAELTLACETSDQSRVRYAFLRALGREPAKSEGEEALRLVAESLAASLSEGEAWALLCQGLLISNEFRYVD